MNVQRLATILFGISSLVPLSMSGQQVPGPHPAYLQALGDLRAARHYPHDDWAWAPVKTDDSSAIHESDAAINRIKVAAIDDGKDYNDPFPIDTSLSPHDRSRKADQLLYAAHRDLDRAEDVPQSRRLRNEALGHIDRAHNIVKTAENTAKWEQ